MIIFISGASGYLGSYLVKSLSKQHRVISLQRSTSSIERGSGVDVVYIDKADALENAFALHQPDIVINTAGLYGRKGESFAALVNANIDFPTQLLLLADKYNSKAFIHTGTSLPDNISAYALTKNTFVKFAQYSIEGNLKFVNVALEHFYGPEEDNSKFISYVIKTCISGHKLALTMGLQKRDFIYIVDVVDAYKVLIANLDELEPFETIPVGTGLAPTIRELVEVIHVCCHSTSTLEFGAVPMRANELMYSCADINRLKQLNWQPAYSLKAGIQATLKGQ